MKKKKIYPSQLSTFAQNKRASFEYFIKEEFEAGLVLQGWELKSLRANKVNLSNSYVIFHDGEAYLFGAHVTPLGIVASYVICDPMRNRKLLLNKHELQSLMNRVNQEGYTILALSMYWKNAWCKVKIGIAKGKKAYDKRNNIKNREWQKTKSRIMKYANY